MKGHLAVARGRARVDGRREAALLRGAVAHKEELAQLKVGALRAGGAARGAQQLAARAAQVDFHPHGRREQARADDIRRWLVYTSDAADDGGAV